MWVQSLLKDRNSNWNFPAHFTSSFLQEKQSALPEDDLGRNVAAVESLQRTHERFESEISALGSQVGLLLFIWSGLMIDLGRETDDLTTKCVSVFVFPCAQLKLYDSLVLSTVLGRWSPTFFFLHSFIPRETIINSNIHNYFKLS